MTGDEREVVDDLHKLKVTSPYNSQRISCVCPETVGLVQFANGYTKTLYINSATLTVQNSVSMKSIASIWGTGTNPTIQLSTTAGFGFGTGILEYLTINVGQNAVFNVPANPGGGLPGPLMMGITMNVQASGTFNCPS